MSNSAEKQETHEGMYIEAEQTSVPLVLDEDALALIVPVRLLISGPTSCGKSHLIFNLIKHRQKMFNAPFKKIVYSVPPNTGHLKYDFIEELKSLANNLEVIEGIPLPSEFPQGQSLLVIEDQFLNVINSSVMYNYMIHDSHHYGISLCISSQNPYQRGLHTVNLSRNLTARIIFQDPGNTYVLRLIGSAIYPEHPLTLIRAMNALIRVQPLAKSKYLFLDLSPHSKRPINLKIQSNIFDPFPLFFFPNT